MFTIAQIIEDKIASWISYRVAQLEAELEAQGEISNIIAAVYIKALQELDAAEKEILELEADNLATDAENIKLRRQLFDQAIS